MPTTYDISPPATRQSHYQPNRVSHHDHIHHLGTKSEVGVEEAKEESERKEGCCGEVDCVSAKWAILRFAALCFLALIILLGAYGLKKSSKHKGKNSLDSVYAVGDPVFARDLWLVIELPSDSRGRRTRLGKQLAKHVCSAVRAGQNIGWTPLVVGGRSTCCRSSRCRHLHPADLPKMNHSSSSLFWEQREDVRSAMRTAAFLAAIKRGAHFIFHANPEVYFRSDVDAATYQSELEHQLRKMTLGISVGLVKETPETSYHFDPYAHFGADHQVRRRQQQQGRQGRQGRQRRQTNDIEGDGDEAKEGDIIHKYKICEIRPPSLEKFLDTDGFSLDASAPALTLPGHISSPFDSRNTLFARDSFWSLLLVPFMPEGTDGTPLRDTYVIRSIVAQAILAEVAGSTKFSVARTPTSPHVKQLAQFGPKVTELLDHIHTWTCESSTALQCLSSLTRHLIERGVLEEEMGELVSLWIQDLLHVGYFDIHTVHDDVTPCIGGDALNGVYFHPAVQFGQQQSRGQKSIESSHPKDVISPTQLNREVTSRLIQRLCPTVDVEQTTKFCLDCDKHENILLIVNFNKKEYNNIPLFEVVYRHHFQNILYCGEPDELVDRYMDQYNGIQGTYFSFLPAHSKSGYECLLGAIEMGYDVDGYMVITQETLINSWNFQDLDPSTIWHGNEHVQNISLDNIHEIDPDGSRVMKSTHGILEALEFLEDVLLKKSSGAGQDLVNSIASHSRHRRSADAVEDHQIHIRVEEVVAEEPARPLVPQGRSISGHRPADLTSDDQSVLIKLKGRDRSDESGEDESHVVPEDEYVEIPFTASYDNQEEMEDFETGEDYGEDDGQEEAGDKHHHDHHHNHDMMSITEHENATKKMLLKKHWHISLFGEIIQDDEDEDEDILAQSQPNLTLHLTAPTKSFRNASELLFHPANFDQTSAESEQDQDQDHDQQMGMDHFSEMMYTIHEVYKKISDKLNFWQTLVKNGKRKKDSGGRMKDDHGLGQFQCDISTNSEICHLVAGFFQVLESNEGANFRLFFDDLPIYYVPSKYKDRLYLMANLFTKYHVLDEMAFPLLLRGLSETSTWTDLKRADMMNFTDTPTIDKPQDLLLLDILDERNSQLNQLESAHYIYPVETSKVLQNDAMRDVICRNF